MAGTTIAGVIVFRDDSKHPFEAGPRERIKAERKFGIKLNDLEEGQVSEEYLLYLAFEALRREGELVNVGFDAFIDDELKDYELDADPESEAPLGS